MARSPPVLPSLQAAGLGHATWPWSDAPQPEHLCGRPHAQGVVLHVPLLKLRQGGAASLCVALDAAPALAEAGPRARSFPIRCSAWRPVSIIAQPE